MLYISARICIPKLVCRPVRGVVIIWQAQNGDPIRVYRSSKTPDKYRVCVLRDPYGVAILKLVLGHVR